MNALGHLHLLDDFPQVPGTLSKWQSSFKASDLLLELVGAALPPRVRLKRRELIELRDINGFPVHCPERDEINAKRRRVDNYNQSIADLEITLPTWFGRRKGDILLWENSEGKCCSINSRNTEYRRIYNVNFYRGGRWYGHFIQNLPKKVRKEILMNGELVAEPDYSALHPSILYRMLGLKPAADMYDIDGWERSRVKSGLLILINATNYWEARGALVYSEKLEEAGLSVSEEQATKLIWDIKRKHHPIAGYFHSNVGVWCQNLDSDMHDIIVRDAAREGIPLLGVHDSYLCPVVREAGVKEMMSEAFEQVIFAARRRNNFPPPKQRVRRKTSDTIGNLSSLPLPSSSVPVFACVPPSPGCRAVAAFLPRCLPAFFDPERRITPLGRFAVLAAKRRRVLRQDDLAGLVGVRRSTLSNLLQGRFRASPQTAGRLVEFVASTPSFERQPYLPGLAP